MPDSSTTWTQEAGHCGPRVLAVTDGLGMSGQEVDQLFEAAAAL
jgi:hypothetical protein